MTRQAARIAIAVGAFLGAAGCASSAPAQAPDWYAAHLESQEAKGYPRLEDVPRAAAANVDVDYWRRESAELLAEAAKLKADPRAQPAGEETDPAAFDAAARAEIEATRNSH